MVAHELPKAERDRVYDLIVERAPGFGEYQKKTDRVIPVFELAGIEYGRADFGLGSIGNWGSHVLDMAQWALVPALSCASLINLPNLFHSDRWPDFTWKTEISM